MNLYRNRYSDHRTNAQDNLMGRTHYVDPDSLRFHKSRILYAKATSDGLLFYIRTKDALDMNNTRRGYRYVIFDLFGTVISRTKLEDAFSTQRACEKAMWAALNAIDAQQVTRDAIEQATRNHASEMAQLLNELNNKIPHAA